MSFGRLNSAVLAAGVETMVYTVPANCVGAEVNINVVNPGANDTQIEIALTTTASAAAADFIEKGAVIAATGGTLEITDLKMSPGERVHVKSTQTGAVVRISGKEISSL